MSLRPLGNTVLFQFLDATVSKGGRFTERTSGSIILPVLDSNQKNQNRWGKVVAVGPKVEGLEPGDFILIQALQWTFGSHFEDDKIWKTNDEQILAVTNDEDSTIQF